MEYTNKTFNWEQRGLQVLHRHLPINEDLTSAFKEAFGTTLDKQQLSDALMCGYFFHHPTHNVSLKDLDDFSKLGIEV